MKMYIGGEWVDRGERTEVVNPYDGSVIDTVPRASIEDVDAAIASAARGAATMAKVPAYERFLMLRRAADLLQERLEEHARTISIEEGKVIAEGRTEVGRAVQAISLSGEEAKRLYGETVPMDAAPGWTGQLGFTLRVPCGVVVAISPFNFPLNLVAHKVGPALAAGERGDYQAGVRHAVVSPEADGGVAGGRGAARGGPVHHRLWERAGRRAGGGPPCAEGDVHGQPGRWRAHLP